MIVPAMKVNPASAANETILFEIFMSTSLSGSDDDFAWMIHAVSRLPTILCTPLAKTSSLYSACPVAQERNARCTRRFGCKATHGGTRAGRENADKRYY
jgi:hypothetical protein